MANWAKQIHFAFPQIPPKQRKRRFADGLEVCKHIKALSSPKDRTRVGFSLGKDSLGSILQMRRVFDEIIPVFLEVPPLGLDFNNEAVDYYEKALGVKIVRVAHPGAARILKECAFQPPEVAEIIDEVDLPVMNMDDVYHSIGVAHGMVIPWGALGIRATDSIVRRTTIRKHGPVNYQRYSYFPIFDWNHDRLEAEIKKSGIKLPAMYRAAGRSAFDSIEYTRLLPIKRFWPRDYERIIEMWPMAEMELLKWKKFGLPVE